MAMRCANAAAGLACTQRRHSTRSLSERRWMPCSMPRERRRLYPQEYTARGKGHHGRRETPATVRGEPAGVRTPEAPGGVSSFYPRVPRLPPRDRIALAILRPLRDTVGHALPRLRQPVAPARCACLPSVWCGPTTGPALRPGRGCQAFLGLCVGKSMAYYRISCERIAIVSSGVFPTGREMEITSCRSKA